MSRRHDISWGVLRLGLFFLVLILLQSRLANASVSVCICHNINNNPHTICPNENGVLNGHDAHIANGNDTLGSCEGCNVDCDDGNPCTDDGCAPGNPNECIHTPSSGSSCDDGNACTESDTCSQGQCVGAPINCDDGSCGEDICVAGVCTHDVSSCPCEIDADCDDGNDCTENHCVQGACTSGNVPLGSVCSDGDACTSNDACSASGVCVPGAATVCGGLSCNPLSCDSASGACVESNDTCECAINSDCVDGDPCTADFCEAGLCSNPSQACGSTGGEGEPGEGEPTDNGGFLEGSGTVLSGCSLFEGVASASGIWAAFPALLALVSVSLRRRR